MDNVQTYQSKRYTLDVMPTGLIYVRVNDGREGFLARVRDPKLAKSLAIQENLARTAQIPRSTLHKTIDNYGDKKVAKESENGNPVAVAVGGTPGLEFSVDSATGLVVDPTQTVGADRVGRY